MSNGLTAVQGDGIEHVVLLIMENHSFDQMLGSLQEELPELNGVTTALANTRSNVARSGELIYQRETTERQMMVDPKHEHDNVLRQLEGNNGGFVRDLQLAYPHAEIDQIQNVMGYYAPGFLPALHTLGREFTVCDNWFSSLPGPTWPNRFFALTGTCSGQVAMPSGPALLQSHWYTEQQQPTLFSRMSEKGKPWKIYHYDFPCSLVLTPQREAKNLARYSAIDNFFKEARGAEQDFPALAFIEPQYFGVGENDDHPPHNVMKAEKLIADVYNAIRSNDALWQKTLLVVFYDEHGGFYDHVLPPGTIPPDDNVEAYSFSQLGVRVPALLVSPHCARRVEHTLFDHTSVLKYLIDKWDLAPLGARTAAANTISCALNTAPVMRTDTTPFIRVANQDLIPENFEAERNASNANQTALHHCAEMMYQEADSGLEHLVDLAAGAASIGNGWSAVKHAIGAKLVAFGHWLSQDMRHQRELRQLRTKQALAYLKQKRNVAETQV